MKKLFYLTGLSILISLTSCSTGEYNETHSFSSPTVNLITNVNDGTTILSKGSYTFNLTTSAQKGTIAGTDLVVDNSSMSFTTAELPYTSPTMYEAIFKNVSTTTTGSYNLQISNGDFLATPYYYYPGFFGITSPYNPTISLGIPDIVIASYNLGNDYKVKTFQQNTFYKGETTTTYMYAGNVETYKTEDIIYGLILNLNDKNATLILYNAKFSGVEAEPVKSQINLNNLSYDCSNGMITVTGENVIPEVVEGTQATPYPSYTFNKVEFKTVNDNLTTANITYQVAGMYNGSFTGNYAETEYKNQ